MLPSKVHACIDAYTMLSPSDKVIVAVSGGPDSMALLHILYQLQGVYDLTLIVVHINHQLRGLESEREADFVEQYSQRLQLPFYQTWIDVKAFQYVAKLSLQHAARQLRYHLLSSLLSAFGATRVALGHTADDQAETFFMRLLRGSSLTGLAGIPAVRSPFIRPLITTYREDILAYLRANQMGWMEDSSNTCRTYLRNRIRLDLFPVLRQYNPQVVLRLNELNNLLRADNDVLEQLTDDWASQVLAWKTAQQAIITCSSFRTAPLAIQRRLLRRVFNALLLPGHLGSFRHIEALRQFLLREQDGRRLSLPGRLLAERYHDTVRIWSPDRVSTSLLKLTLPVPGSVTVYSLNLRLTADIIRGAPDFTTVGTQQAFLDLARISPPLMLRFRQPGDRFYPLGAPGWKKLQDFFVDQKVPRAERPHVPLVVSAQEIVWVVGYRIAETCKMHSATRRILRLRCQNIVG